MSTSTTTSSTILRNRKTLNGCNNGHANHAGVLPLHRRKKLGRPNETQSLPILSISAMILFFFLLLGVAFYHTPPQQRFHNKNRDRFLQKKQSQAAAVAVDGVYDMAIVGSGPAGLTCALFAARAGLNVLVLGSSTGLLSETKHLDNFPSYTNVDGGGPGWLKTTKEQAVHFGANFAAPGLLVYGIKQQQHTSAEGSDSAEYFALETPLETIRAWSVVVATGANPRQLGLPHEEDLWATSLHSCAICDGHLYTDKTVLVVGGGDAAMDAAILLARYARRVVVVHRRTQFSGSNQVSIDVVQSTSNIELWMPFVVKEWEVDPMGPSNLASAKIQNVETKEIKSLQIDGAFVMIGADPNTDWLKGFVDLDPEGLIRLTKGTESSVPGLFASGEVTDNVYKQAITAAAAGAEAAIDAERWLRETRGVVQRRVNISKQTEGTPTKAQERLVVQENQQPDANTDEINCDLTQQDCINNVIHKHKVVVFSKPWCPYCRRALEALALAGLKEPFIIDLSKHTNTQDIQSTLKQMTGRRTVPNVFVGGKSIGGGDETKALQDQGKLATVLIQAGALPPRDVVAWTQQQRALNSPDNGAAAAAGPDDCDMTLQDCINSIVQKYKVVVFSKPWCPYCRKALEALSVAGLKEPHVIDLSKHANTQDIQSTLQRMTGRRTVPNVFVGGKSIGGGDETSAFQRQGKLVPMLEEAGALPKVDDSAAEAKTLASNCNLESEDCFKEIVRTYPAVMFSLAWCPECKRELELLNLIGVHPHIIDLDDHKEIQGIIRQHMKKMTGRNQVPNLFVGGDYIGGYKRTSEIHGKGELIPKFQKVGML